MNNNNKNYNKPLTVRELLKIDFKSLQLAEQIKIRDLGPPRPVFQLRLDTDSVGTVPKKPNLKLKSHVNSSRFYRENDWLCGCEHKKLFYCFPCLLFNPSQIKGFPKLNDTYHRHHFKSSIHVQNALNLTMIGKTISINGIPSKEYRKMHNIEVERNRQILHKITKGLLEFTDLYEYVLNGEKSWNTKLHPYTLIDLLSKVDSTLKEYFSTSPLFSSIIPSDLEEKVLKAAFNLYQTKVLEETNLAKYLAIIVEETTDLAHQDQLVIILRYVLDNRVVERFWTLVNLKERDLQTVTQSILNELEIILPVHKEKLIAQSHIGAVIYSPLISDIHRLITEHYKNAIYVHYHAYKLTEVMERAVCQNSRVRDFFANLYGIYAFFVNQPKILQGFLDTTPIYSENSFEKGALVFFYENKLEILNFMIMLHTDLDSSPQYIREADVCEKLLTDDSFLYFLTFFYYLMADVNVFYQSLQNSCVDSTKIAQAINEFLDEISKTKDAIAVENSDNDDKTSEAFMRAFTKIEVCNVILKEIQERFRFTNHWEAHILFKSDQFYKFHGNFPEYILTNAIEYFKFQFPEKLRVELKILYSRPDFMVCRNAHDLLWSFNNLKLKSVFDKTTALLQVILTIPTMLAEDETKISSVRRVRRAVALTSNQENTTPLTMLLSEKDTLKSFNGFADELIKVFAKNEGMENEFTFF